MKSFLSIIPFHNFLFAFANKLRYVNKVNSLVLGIRNGINSNWLWILWKWSIAWNHQTQPTHTHLYMIIECKIKSALWHFQRLSLAVSVSLLFSVWVLSHMFGTTSNKACLFCVLFVYYIKCSLYRVLFCVSHTERILFSKRIFSRFIINNKA